MIYDVRPAPRRGRRARGAIDVTRREAGDEAARPRVLEPWILPTGNFVLKDPSKRHTLPEGNPGSTAPYVQAEFDDRSWERVNLPHDWAIKGPFLAGWSNRGVGGGMGRLPSPGVGWYRKEFSLSTAHAGKSIFLDVDGAMSYAVVGLNGTLVGGWPCGYASWRVDLTPYIVPGEENLLAIRSSVLHAVSLASRALTSAWGKGGKRPMPRSSVSRRIGTCKDGDRALYRRAERQGRPIWWKRSRSRSACVIRKVDGPVQRPGQCPLS